MDARSNQPDTSPAAEPLPQREELIEPAVQPAAPPPIEREAEPSFSTLIESIIRTTESSATLLNQFLAAGSITDALKFWLRNSGERIENRDTLLRSLNRDIARIDKLLSDQVNRILHHERFQQLQASWLGLHYLVDQIEDDQRVQVKLLNSSWRELTRDMERAPDFDRSQLFLKVYEDEFGTPGGKPFGMLLGDYYLRHKPSPSHKIDDLATLKGISQVAAAAFAPFISAAHPAMFGLDEFADMERPMNLSGVFEGKEYTRWNSFRKEEDSRFVGLTMPRVLMRIPHQDDGSRDDGFRFREDHEARDRSEYLWGNAAYAFGAVGIRAFEQTGWLADIRGVQRGIEGGGLVTGLPIHSFGTDFTGVAPKTSTEVIITDAQEKEIADLGFMPLCHCKDTEFSAFYSNQSIQLPKGYDRVVASTNAKMSAMLQYTLCVSRFAHYIKIIARDKVGSFNTADECQKYLSRWLLNYCASTDDLGIETQAKYPLREGNVQVRERPGKPGSYQCVLHLRPHFQLDQLINTVRLSTELRQAHP